MRIPLFPFSILVLSVSAASAAEYTLPPIVVTGARIDDPGSASVVLDRAEIANGDPKAIDSVLNQLPGVELVGGSTGIKTISIRGGSTQHTLVYVDGVPVNDASDPNCAFDGTFIDVDEIQRIEIIKGPQSVSYGSSGMAGVVLISTRLASEEFRAKPGVWAKAEGGAREYGKVDGRIYGLAGKDAAYELTVGREHETGNSSAAVAGGDRDGFDSTRAGGRVRFNLSDTQRIMAGANYRVVDRDLDDGAFFDNPNSTSHSKEWRGDAQYQGLWDGIETRATTGLYRNSREYDDPNGYFSRSELEGGREFVDADLRIRPIDRSTILVGASALHEWIETMNTPGATNPPPGNVRRIGSPSQGVFAQVQWPFGRFLLETGGRSDWNHRLDEDNRQVFTYQGGIHYAIDDGTELYGRYGTGFRQPSLFSVYDPTYGNPNLKPESSKSGEIGARARLSKSLSAEIAAFQWTYSNLIEFNAALGPMGSYDNVSKARIRGVEAGAPWQATGAFRLKPHVTYLDTRDENRKRELPYRPKWKGGLVGTYAFGDAVEGEAEFLALSSRHDYSNAPYVAGGYGQWNLAVAWKAWSSVKLHARVEDLFDRSGVDSIGYTPDGRSVYAGVEATF